MEIRGVVIRRLKRDEIRQIWSIDRREVIEKVYHLEDGGLVLKPEYYDMQGWPPGERDLYTPILYDCFDRGGTFYGAFQGSRLIGVVVLESKFIGREGDQLQMKLLHISREYREKGLGRRLFEKAVAKARKLGAKRLYISATPSQNTVDFYLHMGCMVTEEVDEDLFKVEPEDIHLEYRIPE